MIKPSNSMKNTLKAISIIIGLAFAYQSLKPSYNPFDGQFDIYLNTLPLECDTTMVDGSDYSMWKKIDERTSVVFSFAEYNSELLYKVLVVDLDTFISHNRDLQENTNTHPVVSSYKDSLSLEERAIVVEKLGRFGVQIKKGPDTRLINNKPYYTYEIGYIDSDEIMGNCHSTVSLRTQMIQQEEYIIRFYVTSVSPPPPSDPIKILN